MKRIFALLTALALVCVLMACGETGSQSDSEQSQSVQEGPSGNGTFSSPQSAPDKSVSTADGASNVLVAYFSATGNTAGIARHVQTILDADLYEIAPEVPYTSDDLDYGSDSCRANQEHNDPDARPVISGTLEDLEDYDVVFLGYPIWWGQAPKIIYTFLESYDFAGVTIVPFCTSGSSGIDGSLDDIQALAPDTQWLAGQRFSGSASQSAVADWIEGLDLLPSIGGEFETAVSVME